MKYVRIRIKLLSFALAQKKKTKCHNPQDYTYILICSIIAHLYICSILWFSSDHEVTYLHICSIL